MIEFSTVDGYDLAIYFTADVDIGLEIRRDGKLLYSNPGALDSRYYGYSFREDLGEWKPWGTNEWVNCLRLEGSGWVQGLRNGELP